MGEEDNIDRAFFHCLKEIEISYTSLPKILRLRIEKWVEKFITVGYNLVWKKNRNMYAKLLLSMIISKSLSDPFHCSPAEGDPLPPFPSYLIPKFKSALGPHESYFWRNIFDRVHEPALVTYAPPPQSSTGSHNNHHSNRDNRDNQQEKSSDFNAAPSPSYIKLDPSQKETHNLRLLMKEQSRRIELMEEQMQQERLKHQSEIQNVLQQSLDETNRIKSIYRSSTNADHTGYSHRNDSIVSSNPYEIYDGNTTYGIQRAPSPRGRSPNKPVHVGSYDMRRNGDNGSHLNASYLPQNVSNRSASGPSFPRYEQHHNPHSKYSESYLEKNIPVNQDYSIGVPVFTPGKEEKSTHYADATSQQKTPLRSASKVVNFQDNRHDIKPLSFTLEGNGNRENKDIYPPTQQFKSDIAPGRNYSNSNSHDISPHNSPITGRGYRPDSSYEFHASSSHGGKQDEASSPLPNSRHVSSSTPSSPFARESIWPNYYQDNEAPSSGRGATTYEQARSTVNREDSSVAPILKREVPEDEGEFMSYLEDFQKEIRHLQFNTTHNKGI
jgi:hypothetical protein